MFKKEEEKKDGKLNKKDVGLLEDMFEAIKQACGIETHNYGNLVIKPNLENLKTYNESRRKRTELMEIAIKKANADLQNQDWCRIKHICSLAMHVQELSARLSILEDMENIPKLTEMHKELYLQFLTILGVNEDNIDEGSPTSA